MKKYQKPTIMIDSFVTDAIIATSFYIYNGGTTDETEPNESKGRRGLWGDLWAETED